MLKKIALGAVGFLLLATPLVASAQTASLADLQAELAVLLQQLSQLQAQYGTASAGGGTTGGTSGYATFTAGTSTSPDLSITGINAPAQLQILQSGTWQVFADSATSTDPLLYAAVWGDASSTVAQSSPTFTHAYAAAGTYQPNFTVTDTVSGDIANASTTVIVSDNETPPPSSSCPNITQTLSLGMTDAQTGGQVSALQRFLTGYFNLDGSLIVGTFGSQTQSYVAQFQTDKGISPVGFVGPQTRAAIAAACASTANTDTLSASPTSGATPLSVTFSASRVPSGASINFGDGTIEQTNNLFGNGTTNSAGYCSAGPDFFCSIPHTYISTGTYTATLKDTSGNTLGSTTITVPGSNSTSCIVLTHNLYLDISDGVVGGDVTKLQQFLIAGGYLVVPQGASLGYFGPATMQAVQAYQAANGIVSSGMPDTTGYGYVGPKTRAAMAQSCGGVPTPPAPSGTFSASPASGAAALAVTFTVPYFADNATLSFGDGATTSVASATCTGSCPQRIVQHTYGSAGTYTAQLTEATSSVVCTGISYDPNNPLSFLNLGTGSCSNSSSTTVLRSATITVQGAMPLTAATQPSGSYSLTCDNVGLTGKFLSAHCRTIAGEWKDSTLDLGSCIFPADIANMDGQLTCILRVPLTSPPPGSYSQSCNTVGFIGSTLTAHCQTTSGQSVDSSLDVGTCKFDADIQNADGKLTCTAW